MRRALVLTDESARHPFRASLPLHVRQPLPETRASRFGWINGGGVWRQFFATYAIGFVAVTAFIS